jgi:hypothetical protein
MTRTQVNSRPQPQRATPTRRSIPRRYDRGYPLHPSSFVASVGVHGIAILMVAFLTISSRTADRRVFDEMIRANEHKLTYYNFKKKTPDVVPVKKIGTSPKPRGKEVSKQAIIATAPKATSKEQMIWMQTPKIEIHKDLPAPNIVQRASSALPPPAAPPKPNPKVFVPPPPSERQPKLPEAAPLLDAAAPSIGTRTFLAPRPNATALPLQGPVPIVPAAPTLNNGNAAADLAIASLHPADTFKSEIPPGARPGQFSKAPEKGDPSSGDVGDAGALTVPNLTIRNEKPKPEDAPKPAAAMGRPVLYSEKLRSVPSSTFSVPLRPASRTVPRAIDARFSGRNIYTMVIPIENMPEYAGDWIIWFAERTPVAGDSPLIRAPVPFRKMVPDTPLAAKPTVQRIQIGATLGADGKLAQVAVLSKAGPALTDAVLRDADSWEFKPATRDGAPVSIEVVIEIPFNVPAAIAQQIAP